MTGAVLSRRGSSGLPRMEPLPAAPASERLFYLDACRATFVLLGIVLHSAFPFIAAPWVVESPNQSDGLAHFFNFITTFRMPAFFLVSGFFAALVLSKRGPSAWARSRTARLGVPFLFGVLFIVPWESVALALGEHLGTPGPVSATAILFDAFQHHARIGFHLVAHLWFILDLLLISLAFAALYAVLGGDRVARIGGAIGDISARHQLALGIPALAALALYLVVVERVARSLLLGNMFTAGGSIPMLHILDGYRLAYYVPFFALGVMLFYSRDLLAAFVRPSLLVWAAGITVTATLLAVLARPGTPWWLASGLTAPAAILITQMSMQAASLLVRKRNRVVQWLSEGSYTIYIVHQPIVVLLATFAILHGLPAIPGFLLVLAFTTILSAGFYAATRNVPLAAFLLNGIVPKRAEERPAGGLGPAKGAADFVPASGETRRR